MSDRCASLSDDFSSRLAEVHDDLSRQVREAQAAVADNAKSLRAHEEAIALRATQAFCGQKADQADHLALENAVREGLRRRAAVRTVRGVQGDVAALKAKCEYLDQVAGISRRFIEWFHNRGSAYEQNCVAIERQLNSLCRQRPAEPRGVCGEGAAEQGWNRRRRRRRGRSRRARGGGERAYGQRRLGHRVSQNRCEYFVLRIRLNMYVNIFFTRMSFSAHKN